MEASHLLRWLRALATRTRQQTAPPVGTASGAPRNVRHVAWLKQRAVEVVSSMPGAEAPVLVVCPAWHARAKSKGPSFCLLLFACKEGVSLQQKYSAPPATSQVVCVSRGSQHPSRCKPRAPDSQGVIGCQRLCGPAAPQLIHDAASIGDSCTEPAGGVGGLRDANSGGRGAQDDAAIRWPDSSCPALELLLVVIVRRPAPVANGPQGPAWAHPATSRSSALLWLH